MIGVIRVSAAVPLRSGENFVLNRWRIADAVNDFSMLVACGLFEEIAAALRLDERVSVKFGKVRRNDRVLWRPQLRERPVEPRPGADTVTRVDGGLPRTSLSAEIGVPRVTVRAGSRGKRLAVRIGARQTAKVSAFTEANAGDEKGHSSRSRRRATGGRRDTLGIRRVLLSQHRATGQNQSTQDDTVSVWLGHIPFRPSS